MQLVQQRLQLIKNDNATAGPACSAVTTPGKVKIEVETNSTLLLKQENHAHVMYV